MSGRQVPNGERHVGSGFTGRGSKQMQRTNHREETENQRSWPTEGHDSEQSMIHPFPFPTGRVSTAAHQMCVVLIPSAVCKLVPVIRHV